MQFHIRDFTVATMFWCGLAHSEEGLTANGEGS